DRIGDLIGSVYQMFVGLLSQAKGLSPLDVVQADPHANLKGDEAWLVAATVRHQAIYLTVTTLDVPGSAAAAAAKISKQAVSKALRSVEDSRDDPAIDRMLDEFEGLVRDQGVGP
ncbi:hypothetical protein, partial [Pseudovibrio sp. POLY-S9]|uniref:hypothetical protein n=1 Tax=Pseudovibrio sp. POLY-S9 TaxID=1576596 RepID=UPI00191065BA